MTDEKEIPKIRTLKTDAEEARRRVQEALGHLAPSQELILRLHWGMTGPVECSLPGVPPAKRTPGSRLTLQEIGDMIGVTKERVRQLELKAKDELEEWLRMSQ